VQRSTGTVAPVRQAAGPPAYRPQPAARAVPAAPPVARPSAPRSVQRSKAAAPSKVPPPYRPQSRAAIQRSRPGGVVQRMDYADLNPLFPSFGLPQSSNDNYGTSPVATASSSASTNTQTNAGTKPLAFTTDNKYVVKIGSEREEFAYGNANALGLANVLVEARAATPVNPSGPITAVTINGKQRQLSNPLPRPQGAERLIATKRMGKGNAASTFTMDIKIGTHTKSEEQFQLEGASHAWRVVKWMEHDIKDSDLLSRRGPLFHGSRARGFDVDPKGQAAFHTNSGHGNFNAALAKIVQDVHGINATLGNNPAAVFVGSSLFCFFDLNSPMNSRARILDPDHPILVDETNVMGVAKPPTLMDQANFDAQQQTKWWGKKNWNAYSQGHVASFLFGLTQVEQALTNQTI
jgi:hypothetical protein